MLTAMDGPLLKDNESSAVIRQACTEFCSASGHEKQNLTRKVWNCLNKIAVCVFCLARFGVRIFF